METVLLQGYINNDLATSTLQKIKQLMNNQNLLKLEIDSDGGEVTATLGLIDNIQRLEAEGLSLEIFITKASSCAALLALSVGSRKTIRRNASISLHTGQLENVPLSLIDLKTGSVSEQVLKAVREYSERLREVLSRLGVARHTKLMSILYATDWLVLSDKACLSLGIVSEIV